MIRDLFSSLTHRFASRVPLFVHGATWTLFLTITVAIISLAPQYAFFSAIFPSSSSSSEGVLLAAVRFRRSCFCSLGSSYRGVLFAGESFRRSKMDLIVSPVFAAIVVALSAVVVRTMGLWEAEETH